MTTQLISQLVFGPQTQVAVNSNFGLVARAFGTSGLVVNCSVRVGQDYIRTDVIIDTETTAEAKAVAEKLNAMAEAVKAEGRQILVLNSEDGFFVREMVAKAISTKNGDRLVVDLKVKALSQWGQGTSVAVVDKPTAAPAQAVVETSEAEIDSIFAEAPKAEAPKAPKAPRAPKAKQAALPLPLPEGAI